MANDAAILGALARIKRIIDGALMGALLWAIVLGAAESQLSRNPGPCYNKEGLAQYGRQAVSRAVLVGAVFGAVGGAIGGLFAGIKHWFPVNIAVGASANSFLWRATSPEADLWLVFGLLGGLEGAVLGALVGFLVVFMLKQRERHKQTTA